MTTLEMQPALNRAKICLQDSKKVFRFWILLGRILAHFRISL